MQINAIYSRGRLEFSVPIRFLRDQFSVKVEVPDQEIAPMHQTRIGQRLDAIVGRLRQDNRAKGSVEKADYQALWHEHLEKKYLVR